ncbi:MAG: hypothetical protein QW669_04420 [Desulfurococcaceae archaeon]
MSLDEIIGEHVRVTSEGGNLVIIIDMKSLVDSLIKSRVDELAKALGVSKEDIVIRRTSDMKYKIIVPLSMGVEKEEEL